MIALSAGFEFLLLSSPHLDAVDSRWGCVCMGVCPFLSPKMVPSAIGSDSSDRLLRDISVLSVTVVCQWEATLPPLPILHHQPCQGRAPKSFSWPWKQGKGHLLLSLLGGAPLGQGRFREHYLTFLPWNAVSESVKGIIHSHRLSQKGTLTIHILSKCRAVELMAVSVSFF